MSDDNIIDNGDAILACIALPEDFSPTYTVDAVIEAKREALHKVILALYAAKAKGMGAGAILHALREFQAETTDEIALAISEFDPAYWGYVK